MDTVKEEPADTSEYSLEPLANQDIPLFMELDQQASSYSLGPDFYEKINQYYGDNIRVVRHNGEIVGVVYVLAYGVETVDSEDDPYGEVVSVAVAEEARRKGVGEKLLGFGIEKLKEKNVPRIQLHTTVDNIAMQSLASKMGFIVKEEIPNFYNNTGKAAYRMELANYQPKA